MIAIDDIYDSLHEAYGFFDLLQSLSFRSCDADRQITHAFGKLIPHNAKRGLTVRNNKDPTASRKHVTNDIGDRMRLAGSRRP